MPPKQIGRYEIVKELGRGGMATVYLARDPRFEREVAVKVLPAQFTHDPQFRARFEREAKTIAALEHEAIVPVHDFGEFEGQPYLVMRHMAGGSLAERIPKGGLPLDEIIPIIERIAPTLDAAHEDGIIHRDLKPGNILFDRYGKAYIADFGVVKLAEASAALTMGVIGTPEYMSPEQGRAKEKLDGRSDVYALGVVAFQMLTGRLPFEADTPAGLIYAHTHEPLPDIQSINPLVPEAVKRALEKALAKERAERHPTAAAFADALAGASNLPATEMLAEEPAAPETEVVEEIEEAVAEPPAAPETEKIEEPEKPKLKKQPAPEMEKVVEPQKPKRERPPRKRRVPLWGWLAGGGVAVVLLVWGLNGGLPTVAATVTGTATTTSVFVTPEIGSEKIAFTSKRDGNEEIYVMNIDGSNPANLTINPADDSSPAWSPDGDQILFSSTRNGNTDIYMMDVYSGNRNQTRLTSSAAEDLDATWSPNGRQIIFVSHRDGNYEIYIMDANGDNQTNLSNNSAKDSSPSWSPDGSRIVFHSDRNGNDEIYTMSSNGSNTSRLTNNAAKDTFPAWSPDGEQIAFVSDRDGDSEIYIMDAQGGNQTRLTNNVGEDTFPTWSPDGNRIAYLAARGHDRWIFAMDASSGGNQTRLTNESNVDTHPSWSP